MIATHLGIVDEEAINNMSYVFFKDVLAELGHKLNYDAVVNYAGNSFFEKSWELITKSNPMSLGEEGKTNSSAMQSLGDFFNSATIEIKGAKGHGRKD